MLPLLVVTLLAAEPLAEPPPGLAAEPPVQAPVEEPSEAPPSPDPADKGPTLQEAPQQEIPVEPLASPPLVAAAQYGAGLGACALSYVACGALGTWIVFVPVVGWFFGPCALQAGFCAANALVGGPLQVLVGNGLGGKQGGYLPAVLAMAVAHLAASLGTAAVGALLIGVAVGFALPAAPLTDPASLALYLLNDVGVIIATFITSAIFFATTAAALAAPTVTWAITAEPRTRPAGDEGGRTPSPSPVQVQRF